MSDDLEIRELTEHDFKPMIRAFTRRRIMEGRIESGKDIVALRRFTKLSQKEFARALLAPQGSQLFTFITALSD